jgi:saccharopine dehydrogenase-like NADP-dependent oxidoreductase
MKRIALVGAGRIGQFAADLLLASGDYELTVIDRQSAAVARLPAHAKLRTRVLDVTDPESLTQALVGHYAVISALPFAVTAAVAEAAAHAGVHYLDLTEDVTSTRHVTALAADAQCAFIPQCGLAPGFISIAANDLSRRFDSLRDLQLHVGALPCYPTNALQYNLSWSTEGLINEYCEPCEVIASGVPQRVQPLEGLAELTVDGIRYEAFNTSGGIGSLCGSLAGRVQNLSYRTIRYPGHAAIMKLLLRDLRLIERRELLKEILEHALPCTEQDVVIALVVATGVRDGRWIQESFVRRVTAQSVNGLPRTAIQICTAAAVCAALDLLATNQLPQRGLVRQEDIPLPRFLANRFGRWYDQQLAVPLPPSLLHNAPPIFAHARDTIGQAPLQ